MDLRLRTMCLLVLLGLLSPSLTGLVSANHPAEDQSFTTPHSGIDFPVGWEDLTYFTGSGFTTVQRDYRLLYPAMTSGEGADMAGNGPFPNVQFLIDTGESSLLTWISHRVSPKEDSWWQFTVTFWTPLTFLQFFGM